MKPIADSPPVVERRNKTGRRRDDVAAPDFRDMVENAVQGILLHHNFRPLYANAAFARLFGYANPQELLALPLIRPLIPATLWAQAEADYHDLLRGVKHAAITRIRGVRKDGKEIWLSLTQRVIVWRGAPAVQWNAFDITGQMAAEQSMLDSEHRLRAMLEILPVPIYIARRSDAQLLFVNRKTCLLFQQSAGPLLRGKSVDFFVNPEDRANLSTLLDTVRDIREVEVEMRTAQGRVFTAELAAIIMNYADEEAVLVSLNDISGRKRLEAELFHQASTDGLTGISNRRHFMDQAEQELRRARRFDRDLAVMMIDLDHFKHVNDQYGHAIGDSVLQAAVKLANESLRDSDIMGRLGGEEFAILLPETNLEAAAFVAERLRQNIAEHPVVTVKGSVPCSVSVGVTRLLPADTNIDELLHRADQALYRAKSAGRNRVEVTERDYQGKSG